MFLVQKHFCGFLSGFWPSWGRGCGFPHQSPHRLTSDFSFFTEKVTLFSHRISHIGTVFYHIVSHRISHIGTVFYHIVSHRISHIGTVFYHIGFSVHIGFSIHIGTSAHIGIVPHRDIGTSDFTSAHIGTSAFKKRVKLWNYLVSRILNIMWVFSNIVETYWFPNCHNLNCWNLFRQTCPWKRLRSLGNTQQKISEHFLAPRRDWSVEVVRSKRRFLFAISIDSQNIIH